MKDENIEFFSKIIPFGSIFLILVSSIKLVIYYYYFNINIADFIGIEEYITSFIDDLLYYLLMFGLGAIFNYYLNKNSEFQSKENKKQRELRINELDVVTEKLEENLLLVDLKNPEFIPRLEQIKDKIATAKELIAPTKNFDKGSELDEKNLKFKRRFNRILVTIFIFTLLVTIASMVFGKSNYYKLEFLQGAVYVLLTLLYLYFNPNKSNISYYGFLIVCVFWYVFTDSIKDSFQIKENRDQKVYSIKYEDSIINTNDTLHFLGKSSEYIFLYDIKNKKSTILKTDGIKEINIKSRNKY